MQRLPAAAALAAPLFFAAAAVLLLVVPVRHLLRLDGDVEAQVDQLVEAVREVDGADLRRVLIHVLRRR
eukprot:3806101-Prymnesium_polylepis.1